MTVPTVAAGLAILALLAAVLRLGEPLLIMVVAGCALVGCGLVWLILTILGLLRHPGRRRRVLTRALPAVLIVAVALPALAAVPRLQRSLSRAAMERAATECPQTSSPRWVGTIRLAKIQRMAGTCYLFEAGSFLAETGWVLLPGGAPEPPGTGMTYRHLEGHWYLVPVLLGSVLSPALS